MATPPAERERARKKRQPTAAEILAALGATDAAAPAFEGTKAGGTTVAATALTSAEVAAGAAKIVGALGEFGARRANDDFLWIVATLRRRYPEKESGEVEALARRELVYDAEFRRKQRIRMERDLPKALRTEDPADRAAAVAKILEREKVYLSQRREAMAERAIAAAELDSVRRASPLGAYWHLSPHVREHTLDCLALGEKFWPWDVLDEVHPPLHHGCACSLYTLAEAVERGWMHEDQVPDADEATARAAELLGMASDAMREGVTPREVEAYRLARELDLAEADALEERAHSAEFEAETKEIRARKDTPEAKQRHRFRPAKWTHPNGHPRCALCGDEERTGGICNGEPTRAEAEAWAKRENEDGLWGDSTWNVTPAGKLTLDLGESVDRRRRPQRCKYGDHPATKSIVHAEGAAFVPVCDEHEATARDAIGDPLDVVDVLEIEEARRGYYGEKAWQRFHTGFEQGGEFKGRRTGIRTHALRRAGRSFGKLAGLLDLETPAQKRRSGTARPSWLNGQLVNVPEHRDFARTIAGRTFTSPPGTSDVFHAGKRLDSTHPLRRPGGPKRKRSLLVGPTVRPGQLKTGDHIEDLAGERFRVEDSRPARFGKGKVKLKLAKPKQGSVPDHVVGSFSFGAEEDTGFRLVPAPASPALGTKPPAGVEQRRIEDLAEELRHELGLPALSHVASALDQGKQAVPPVADGMDGAASDRALRQAGFREQAAEFVPDGIRFRYAHPDAGATLAVTYTDAGTATDVTWEPRGLKMIAPRRLDSPPSSFEEFAGHLAALVSDIGTEEGVDTFLRDVTIDPSLSTEGSADHGGSHEWNGDVLLDRLVGPSIENAGAKAAEGIPLTANEKRETWTAYKVAHHEAMHALNPITQDDWADDALRNIEEWLTEESAHGAATEALGQHRLGEVADWAAASPLDERVQGVYLPQRAAADGILDDAGIAPEQRPALIREMKLHVDPGARAEALADLLQQAQGGHRADHLDRVRRDMGAPPKPTGFVHPQGVPTEATAGANAPTYDGTILAPDVPVRLTDGTEAKILHVRGERANWTATVRTADGRVLPATIDADLSSAGPAPSPRRPSTLAATASGHVEISAGDDVQWDGRADGGLSGGRVTRVVRDGNDWAVEVAAGTDSLSPGAVVILTDQRTRGTIGPAGAVNGYPAPRGATPERPTRGRTRPAAGVRPDLRGIRPTNDQARDVAAELGIALPVAASPEYEAGAGDVLPNGARRDAAERALALYDARAAGGYKNQQIAARQAVKSRSGMGVRELRKWLAENPPAGDAEAPASPALAGPDLAEVIHAELERRHGAMPRTFARVEHEAGWDEGMLRARDVALRGGSFNDVADEFRAFRAENIPRDADAGDHPWAEGVVTGMIFAATAGRDVEAQRRLDAYARPAPAYAPSRAGAVLAREFPGVEVEVNDLGDGGLYLHRVEVPEERRGRGLFRDLLARLGEIADERGADATTYPVAPDGKAETLARLRRAYEGAGFEDGGPMGAGYMVRRPKASPALGPDEFSPAAFREFYDGARQIQVAYDAEGVPVGWGVDDEGLIEFRPEGAQRAHDELTRAVARGDAAVTNEQGFGPSRRLSPGFLGASDEPDAQPQPDSGWRFIWPDHGVAGTPSAEVDPRIAAVADVTVEKGMDPGREAYSAFDGLVAPGGKARRPGETGGRPLADVLRSRGTKRVAVGGLATDYCVDATVASSVAEGFETWFLPDASRGIDPAAVEAAVERMRAAGVHVGSPEPDAETALIAVDVQGAFIPGYPGAGELPVPDGEAVVGELQREAGRGYGLVVASRDFHPPNHLSFASQGPGGKPSPAFEAEPVPAAAAVPADPKVVAKIAALEPGKSVKVAGFTVTRHPYEAAQWRVDTPGRTPLRGTVGVLKQFGSAEDAAAALAAKAATMPKLVRDKSKESQIGTREHYDVVAPDGTVLGELRMSMKQATPKPGGGTTFHKAWYLQRKGEKSVPYGDKSGAQRTFEDWGAPAPPGKASPGFEGPAPEIGAGITGGLDYYKATMAQVQHANHPTAQVSFEFRNRNAGKSGGRLLDHVTKDELQARLDRFRPGFSEAELAHLASLERPGGDGKVFSGEFLDYLRGRELPPVKVAVRDGDLAVETSGDWPMASMWETVVLAELNGAYFENYARAKGLDEAELRAEGDRRLTAKIEALREHPEIKLAEFGTRRRFSGEWQRHVVDRLRKEAPGNLVGTSNVRLAHEFGLTPIGSYAHEMDMVYAALADAAGEDVPGSHQRMMDDWARMYGDEQAIALTDTFGSGFFFRSLTTEQARRWRGLRHDSGDPFEFGERALDWYEKHGIDPAGKTLLFSDSLDVPAMVALQGRFGGRVGVVFGVGTNLTNDLGVPPLNVVMKATRANGKTTVKLSDDPGKASGTKAQVERYGRLFGGVPEAEATPGVGSAPDDVPPEEAVLAGKPSPPVGQGQLFPASLTRPASLLPGSRDPARARLEAAGLRPAARSPESRGPAAGKGSPAHGPAADEPMITVRSWAGDEVEAPGIAAAVRAARQLWDEGGRAPGKASVQFFAGGQLLQVVHDRKLLGPQEHGGKASPAYEKPRKAARDVKPGDVLDTSAGPRRVEKIDRDPFNRDAVFLHVEGVGARVGPFRGSQRLNLAPAEDVPPAEAQQTRGKPSPGWLSQAKDAAFPNPKKVPLGGAAPAPVEVGMRMRYAGGKQASEIVEVDEDGDRVWVRMVVGKKGKLVGSKFSTPLAMLRADLEKGKVEIAAAGAEFAEKPKDGWKSKVYGSRGGESPGYDPAKTEPRLKVDRLYGGTIVRDPQGETWKVALTGTHEEPTVSLTSLSGASKEVPEEDLEKGKWTFVRGPGGGQKLPGQGWSSSKPPEPKPPEEDDSGALKRTKSVGAGAELFQDSAGRGWIVQRKVRADQRAQAKLGNAVYRELGIEVPNVGTVKFDGKDSLATPLPQGGSVEGPEDAAARLGAGFMADALLANHEAYGEHAVVWVEGRPVRFGQDGTLGFKRDGGQKNAGAVPQEVWTMLQPGRPGFEAVEVSEEQRREQAGAIAAKLTPERVGELVEAAGFKSEKEAAYARDALGARAAWMGRYARGEESEPRPLEGEEARAELAPAKPLPDDVVGALQTFGGGWGAKANAEYRAELEFPRDDALLASLGGPEFAPVDGPDWSGDVDVGQPLGGMSAEDAAKSTKSRSAGVIVAEPDGRVWMMEPRGGFGGYSMILPKGRVDKGESEQEAALRELFEETGLQAEVTGLVGDYEGDVTITRYFLARRTGGTPTLSNESQRVVLGTPTAAGLKGRDTGAIADAGVGTHADREVAGRLDEALERSRAAEDFVGWASVPEGTKLEKGAAFEERGYLALALDGSVVERKGTVPVRVTVFKGQRAILARHGELADAEGLPDVLAPRGSRLRIVGVGKDGVAEAVLT